MKTAEEPLPDHPPNPDHCSAQVIEALHSVVSVRTRIPEHAMTASVLGTEREGHGVVINDQGLVLTIGYIVTEANSVWLVDCHGNTLQGYVVAYDQQSGLGLVQALSRLTVPPVLLGKSSDLRPDQKMLLAGCGGIKNTQQVQIGGIDEFAGYWEYLLEDAVFTVPAHPFWSGAALIGDDGMLYGIGSLILQVADQDEAVNSANMVIPIDLLSPILDDLLHYGKRRTPPRPWVGWFTQETADGVVIVGISAGGPAEQAGLKSGDVIVAIDRKDVCTLPELYRQVWSAGEAGSVISVTFERDLQEQTISVKTVDRNSLLISATVH